MRPDNDTVLHIKTKNTDRLGETPMLDIVYYGAAALGMTLYAAVMAITFI